ncbi:MAG: hypothetical protein ACJ72Q_19375 [Nitrososphaeraceae archaeon]
MTNIADKVKEKLKDAKDKVASTTKEGAEATKEKMTDAKDKVTSTTKETVGGVSSSSTGGGQTSKFEEGGPGTEIGRKDDPLTEYREKEPMTPAKIKEHEPTAVKRDPSELNIVEPGKQSTNAADAAEKARRSGMTKGTAGAAETGSEYEQGAAGSNE